MKNLSFHIETFLSCNPNTNTDEEISGVAVWWEKLLLGAMT